MMTLFFRIENDLFLPVRSVQLASRYESTVFLIDGNKRINAKSIMGMMSLGLGAGEKVTVVTDGVDEAEAMDNIELYLGKDE